MLSPQESSSMASKYFIYLNGAFVRHKICRPTELPSGPARIGGSAQLGYPRPTCPEGSCGNGQVRQKLDCRCVTGRPAGGIAELNLPVLDDMLRRYFDSDRGKEEITHDISHFIASGICSFASEFVLRR